MVIVALLKGFNLYSRISNKYASGSFDINACRRMGAGIAGLGFGIGHLSWQAMRRNIRFDLRTRTDYMKGARKRLPLT